MKAYVEGDTLEDIPVDVPALDDLRDEFFANGFVLIRNALPPAQVERLLDAVDHVHREFHDHPHRNPNPQGFNMRPVIDKHPAFRELLITPTTFPAVVRFLDHFSIQLLQSHLFEADPLTTEATRGTGWHNDGGEPALEVNGIRAFGSLKVGYFLRDRLAEDMGSLMVVPGSHRSQGPPAWVGDDKDPAGAIQLKAHAGDAVVFHQGTWHAAAPNHANDARILLYYGYGYRVFRPIDYQSFGEEFLTTASPVERQLLGETVNHQGYYLPTVEDTPLKTWYEQHFGVPSNRGNLTRIR